MSYNNLQILNKLSEDEKQMVRQILIDVSDKGKSENLTELYYEDYDEIPVDLHTFLTSDVYLGAYTNHGKDIYETWKNELNFVHNPINAIDQWAITGSIGTGKTQCVVYSLCYDLYKLMCLKNPSRFYGLGEDTIYMFFFNLTLKLSERTAYSRFQRAIQSSPWFMSRGTVSGKKYLEYVPDKNIRFDKGSNLEHALGSACMFVIMDEMSFGKNDDANYQLSKMMEIYNQLHVRLGSRFNVNGIIQGRMYLVSSAKATNAVLESFIRDNENEPRNTRKPL